MGWVLGALVVAMAAGAHAQQNYPNKPVRLIVPLAPGGPSDILARTMAQKMTGGLGQPVVVDNRMGAGGIIGTDVAALPVAQSGRLRAIAVSGAKRSSHLPNVPTIEEAGVAGFEEVGGPD